MKNNNTKTLLKNVCKISKGKGLKHEKVNFTEGQNCILCGDLFTQYDTVIKNVVHKTKYNEGISSKKNTVLIPGDTTTNAWDIAKAVALDEENVLLGGSINILEFDEHCDNTFFAYYLSSKKRIDLAKLAIGSTVVHLHGKEIGNIEVSYPSKEMQAKIGSFFKELDELIEIEEKSTEKLIALQKYFINTYFKSIDREVKLSNAIESKSGHSLEKYKSENGEYKFISIGNYSQDGLYIDDGSRIDITNNTEPYLVNKNDLVMVLNDKTKDGKIIGSTILCEEKMVFNQRSQKIVPGEQILPYFLWLQLNSYDFREKVKRMAQGGTQIYINFSSIEKLTIKIPELEEQKYITNFFKEFSTLISLRQEKVVKLKNMKKYYLNKIFN